MIHIHIFTVEGLYSEALIKLLESSIDMSNHVYIFRKRDSRYSNYPISVNKRLFYRTNFLSVIIKLLPLLSIRNCWVYFHYLPYGPSLLIWAFCRNMLRHSSWIIWGGDLKVHYQSKSNIKSRIYEYLRKRMISNISEIASFIEEDAIEAIRIYNSKATHSQILYPIPINFDYISTLKTKEIKSNKLTILIGNSADPSNNHSDIILILSKYADESLEIICPLSYYSDINYINKIKTIGNDIFGDRFITITDMMTPEKYSVLLNSVDIAIMNHKRQQGLGTIFPLLYLSKKVFLREDISSYRFLAINGCTIYATDKIESLSWQEFVSMDSTILNNNRKIVNKLTSTKYCFELWSELFNKHKDD